MTVSNIDHRFLNQKILTAAASGFVLGWVAAALARQFERHQAGLKEPLVTSYGAQDEQYTRTVGNLLPPPIVPGNKITTLINGREIFPAMLEKRILMFTEKRLLWSRRNGLSMICREQDCLL